LIALPFDWYALVVKPNHEKAVFHYLSASGSDASLPLYRARRRWSDRLKEVTLPLFPGYVFCRFSHRSRVRVLRVPGVRSIVTAGPQPAPIPAREIEAIEALIRSGLPVKPWPFLKIGQKVLVSSGPLRGVEGILVEFRKTWQVIVSVEILQRSVAAEVDRDALSPLT
jgi:transcription antitermination factor NusG